MHFSTLVLWRDVNQYPINSEATISIIMECFTKLSSTLSARRSTFANCKIYRIVYEYMQGLNFENNNFEI